MWKNLFSDGSWREPSDDSLRYSLDSALQLMVTEQPALVAAFRRCI